jgi:hypothetical protein
MRRRMHDITYVETDTVEPIPLWTDEQLVIAKNVMWSFGEYMRFMLVNGMEKATTEQILQSYLDSMSKGEFG